MSVSSRTRGRRSLTARRCTDSTGRGNYCSVYEVWPPRGLYSYRKGAYLPLIKVLHSNVLLAMNIFDISLNMFFFYLDGGRLLESDRIQGLLPRSTCPAGISTPFHCFIAGKISLHSHYMPNTFLN